MFLKQRSVNCFDSVPKISTLKLIFFIFLDKKIWLKYCTICRIATNVSHFNFKYIKNIIKSFYFPTLFNNYLYLYRLWMKFFRLILRLLTMFVLLLVLLPVLLKFSTYFLLFIDLHESTLLYLVAWDEWRLLKVYIEQLKQSAFFFKRII